MDTYAPIAAAVVAAALAGFAGYRAGLALRVRAGWWYWVANACVLLAGVAAVAWGLVAGSAPLWWGGLGAIGGGLTGLKYGLGRIVGRPAARD